MVLQEVWVAGNNNQCQLGLGHTSKQTTLVQMAAAGGDVAAVAGGYGHTLLLKTDGTVWVAGKNNYGQLGLGHTDKQTSLAQMAAAGGDVAAVACGCYYTVLLKTYACVKHNARCGTKRRTVHQNNC